MSKTNVFENDIQKLIFQNIGISLIGDATGILPSAAAGSLYLSLHTADPGEAGSAQTISETGYTGYARKAVVRSAAGFVVTGEVVNPAADQDFPACTAAPGADCTFFGIGTAASGAGKLLYSGSISPTIAMTVGTIPRLTSQTSISED